MSEASQGIDQLGFSLNLAPTLLTSSGLVGKKRFKFGYGKPTF